jgi:hypothetical protein
MALIFWLLFVGLHIWGYGTSSSYPTYQSVPTTLVWLMVALTTGLQLVTWLTDPGMCERIIHISSLPLTAVSISLDCF